MSKSGAILAVVLPFAVLAAVGGGGWYALSQMKPTPEKVDEAPKGLAVFTEAIHRDDLQLIVRKVEPIGAGAAQRALEAPRARAPGAPVVLLPPAPRAGGRGPVRHADALLRGAPGASSRRRASQRASAGP